VFCFTSDNAAGVHPEVLAAMQGANRGHAVAYGHDGFTESAVARIRDHFGDRVEVQFVFNGTGANVAALRGFVQSHQAVVCAESAHLWQDECGAPERLLGCKLVPVPSRGGKIVVDDLGPVLRWRGDVHHSQPAAVSITQATEWGTVYTIEEVRKLVDFAHDHALCVHVDGARLANAAAHLDATLREITTDLGVDVVSFGGTKNGLMYGEAVIVTDPERARDLGFHVKQGMQLASKMRFLSVQFDALLTDDLWLRNARHANSMARRLARKLSDVAGIEIVQPVEANAVFAGLPADLVEPLQRHARFHVWDPDRGIVRLMTAYDTAAEDVDSFAAVAADLASG
jgi:threonine aldolase